MDLLFFLQDAAQAAPAAPPQAAPGLGGMVVPLLLMFVVMYFLMIRPQSKQRKERDLMISNLKKNDHVVTNAGIYGIVKQVSDTTVTLCIDERNDVCIRVSKSSIAGLEGDPKTETPDKKS